MLSIPCYSITPAGPLSHHFKQVIVCISVLGASGRINDAAFPWHGNASLDSTALLISLPQVVARILYPCSCRGANDWSATQQKVICALMGWGFLCSFDLFSDLLPCSMQPFLKGVVDPKKYVAVKYGLQTGVTEDLPHIQASSWGFCFYREQPRFNCPDNLRWRQTKIPKLQFHCKMTRSAKLSCDI